VIRLYADASGGLHFKGKDAELERLAARAILRERRAFGERLHAQNMALIAATVPTGSGIRDVVHLVGDERDEALWRAWCAYAR
jgi:hypothetical protein